MIKPDAQILQAMVDADPTIQQINVKLAKLRESEKARLAAARQRAVVLRATIADLDAQIKALRKQLQFAHIKLQREDSLYLREFKFAGLRKQRRRRVDWLALRAQKATAEALVRELHAKSDAIVDEQQAAVANAPETQVTPTP